MSISVRRKRNSRDLRCILFPDDVKDKLKNTSGVTITKNPTSSLKSWQRCGDGFLDTPVQKKPKSMYQNPTTARLTSEKFKVETEEPVHIAWSSSEGETDCEETSPPPKPVATPTLSQPRPKPKLNVSSYLQLLNSEADELPAIESASELSDDAEEDEVRGDVEIKPDNTGAISDCFSPERDKHEEKQPKEIQTVPDVDITDYPSDVEDGPAVETAPLTNAGPNPVDPSEGGRRSLKDWVRSAQALLRTPQKHASCHVKTPDDSNKKRRKFESGGLADRLNRLQSRQRSAISFWRHQSTADITTTARKPGVLVLQLLHLQEDCGLSVALCQRQRMKEVPREGHQNPSPGHQDVAKGQEDVGEGDCCLVLFSRETVTHLALSPGDLIHVHPPWQTLLIEGESRPVILNAHFSHKVLTADTQRHMAPSPKPLSQAHRCGSYPLNCSWGQQSRTQVPATTTSGDGGGSSRQAEVCERVWPEPRGVCDSLLEALESLGPAGALSQQLEVVLQRVYCLPIPQSSALRLHGLRKSPHAPSPRTSSNNGGGSTIGRLCVLVQDAWGMFSEVQLQALDSEDQLQLLIKQWEGRTCLLLGFKVLQRVTRGRCAPLFSLIDSLWPPTLPFRVHGDPVSCEESKTTAVAPSFCYRLSGSEVSVVVSQKMPLSLLYQPPVMHNLREILQVGKEGGRCSFTANVVFIYLQASGLDALDGESWLLFVTDTSLQHEDESRPDQQFRRTLTIFFSPPLVLQYSVRQAISAALASSTSCPITFRDALLQRGSIVCSEQTTVCPVWAPGDAPHPLSKPLRLDQLGPETAPNTLCALTGVIVGVDEEAAYSWPVCILCESERLERALALQEGFLCTACGAEVLKPIVKMQLEVFLSCPSLSDCTIKMKLLQKTIDSLLSSLDRDPEYYEVESILGKEVGPVSAYVRVITRTPSLWVGLEEVCI